MTHPTGPLPLSDFGSPTIEVHPAPARDDHPLDHLDELILPASEARLLAAMQRIGFLEASLEHWQARAAGSRSAGKEESL